MCLYPTVEDFFNFKDLTSTKLLDVTSPPPQCNFNYSKTTIILGIKSMPKARAHRDALRLTWLRPEFWPENISICHVFLLGTSNFPTKVKVIEEATENRDILQGQIKLRQQSDKFLGQGFNLFVSIQRQTLGSHRATV